jgi:hypothetical protein
MVGIPGCPAPTALPPKTWHQAYCINIVKSAPPLQDEALWRYQVRDILTGLLNRNVMEVKPSLFGIGLFKLSSPNSSNALVQHGHYQLQNHFV